MNTSGEWAAVLAHVQEVSLVGTADLDFWRGQLRKDDFFPIETDDGRAQILIIAAAARFMGIRFRELSFLVMVRRPGMKQGDRAAYLARAFNSSRFFAFCERVFFATPYRHADVRVTASLPAAFHLTQKGEGRFRAELGSGTRHPGRGPLPRGEEGWSGPVLLPGSRPGNGVGGMFFARVCGPTEIYPYLPNTDSLSIEPSSNSEILRALVDSKFVAKEWTVRRDSTHAKSKTYTRDIGLAIAFQNASAEPAAPPDR